VEKHSTRIELTLELEPSQSTLQSQYFTECQNLAEGEVEIKPGPGAKAKEKARSLYA